MKSREKNDELSLCLWADCVSLQAVWVAMVFKPSLPKGKWEGRQPANQQVSTLQGLWEHGVTPQGTSTDDDAGS